MRKKYEYPLIILKQLVITDFKLRYKGSALGYVWTLLKPLMLFAVMYVVFIHFLKFGANIPHFAVQLLLGIVLWNFFVEATMNGMTAIISRGDLMRKLYFPRYVIVLASLLSALINLGINLIVVLLFIAINNVAITPRILLLMPLIIELSVFALGMSFLLSVICVKLRDITYIWELALQVGFYATPIFYPVSQLVSVSQTAAQMALLNPMAQIIQDARWATISPDVPTTWSYVTHPFLMMVPIVVVVASIIISVIYFRKKSPMFAENV